jgi:single-strand DNA-binding protein
MIYGNLTRDPEKRALPNGTQVCSFGVATNRVYNDKDGKKQEQTEYHNVVAFGRLAEIMGQYLQKGRPVYVEGRLSTRSWEKDGQKQYRTEIVADNFQFGTSATSGPSAEASGGQSSPAPENNKTPSTPEYPEEEINPEDIPF